MKTNNKWVNIFEGLLKFGQYSFYGDCEVRRYDGNTYKIKYISFIERVKLALIANNF